MLGDVRRERAQRLEDLLVAFVVRTQLEAIAPRDFERDFEDVDGVKAQTFAVQRLGGDDVCLLYTSPSPRDS